jgi:hypothetical protein
MPSTLCVFHHPHQGKLLSTASLLGASYLRTRSFKSWLFANDAGKSWLFANDTGKSWLYAGEASEKMTLYIDYAFPLPYLPSSCIPAPSLPLPRPPRPGVHHLSQARLPFNLHSCLRQPTL